MIQQTYFDMDHPLVQMAARISDQLDEPNFLSLYEVVAAVGAEQAEALLQRTLQIEAEGGLLITNRQRRRTPGGVFFHLAYTQAGVPRPNIYQSRPFSWEARGDYLDPLLQAKGVVRSMKVQLSGRPKRIEKKDSCVMLAMEQPPLASIGIPRGLPQPPAEPTTCVVYIPTLKWSAVVRLLSQDETSYLTIKGLAQFDPEIPGLAVFANDVQVHQQKRG